MSGEIDEAPPTPPPTSSTSKWPTNNYADRAAFSVQATGVLLVVVGGGVVVVVVVANTLLSLLLSLSSQNHWHKQPQITSAVDSPHPLL